MDEDTFMKNCFEDVQKPAKFKQHRPAILKMISEFQSMWNGQLEHVNGFKYCIKLTNAVLRPVYYPNTSKDRKKESSPQRRLRNDCLESYGAGDYHMVSFIVLVPKKDGLLFFCVDCWILNAVKIHDSFPLSRMDGCTESLG